MKNKVEEYLSSIGVNLEDTKYAIQVSNVDEWEESKQLNKNRKQALKEGRIMLTFMGQDLVEPTWSNFTKPFLFFKFKGASKIYYGREVKLVNLGISKKKRKEAKEFMNKYHEQQFTGAKFYYEFLDKDDNILGVVTFGTNQQYKGKGIIELKRMVFLPDIQIRYALSKVVKNFFKDYPEYTSMMSYSNNNIGIGNAYEKSGFNFVKETTPSLRYYSPSDPQDSYSWSVASSWGAKSGVIARALYSMDINNKEAEQVVINELPHRTDEGKGYLPVYDTGNKLWKISRGDVLGD